MAQIEEEEIAYSGWDKGLDYVEVRKDLEEKIKNEKDIRTRAWYSVFLIQIVNGSRIGEAAICAIQYSDNGKREQRVRVEKRKDKYMRLMVIPEVVRQKEIREELAVMAKVYKDIKDTASTMCRRLMAYNSHAHRYAFIGHMANEMTAQSIARLTGHTKLDLVLHYTSAKIAEAKLRDMVK